MSVRGSDPAARAKNSEYYKPNHHGAVVCTLCNIACNDDAAFLVHLDAKKHAKKLQERVQRDERLARAQKEEAAFLAARARDEAKQSSDALMRTAGTRALVLHGKPKYLFRTDTDEVRNFCQVWFDFYFESASDDTRPFHRWRSAPEMDNVEATPTEVFLVVACEGYESMAFSFPSTTSRSSKDNERLYQEHWDPANKIYHIYFVLGDLLAFTRSLDAASGLSHSHSGREYL